MRTCRTTTTLALMLIGLSTASCGSTMYINKEFRLPPPSESVLAIFPLDFHSKTINDSFEASFALSGIKQVISPGELTKRLKLTSYYHTKIKSGKETDSLQTLLDEKHYQYLVTTLSPATLLLFPSELKYTGTPSSTYLDYAFKLYDLRSGILLYMNSYEDRTNKTGDKAQQELLRSATDRMAQDVNALLGRR
jgi:hypothetical protein